MILSVITGMFKEFGMVLLIIVVHEFGHLMAAIFFNWNTGKIVIYPFGGCCRFDEQVNKPLREELIILLFGPFVQMLFFLLVSYFSTRGLMTYRNYEIFKSYNYTLLIFNLLPIYPLDGGRILNIITNYIFPYKIGNKFIVVVSFLLIVIGIIMYKNLNFTVMGVLLVIEIFLYFKRQNYLYNRMLLERYMENFNFKKLKIIKNKNNMYKDKRHIVLYKNKYVTEKDYLKERFKVR